MRHFIQVNQRASLDLARVILGTNATNEEREAVLEVLSGSSGETQILRSIANDESITFSNAFIGAVQTHSLFEGITPNSEPRTVRLHVKYANDDDHYVIDTKDASVRVEAILFQGTLIVSETLVPISVSSEYRELQTGEVLSQVAAFGPHEIQGMRHSLELHRLGETGETHVVLRKVDDDA